MVEPRYAELFSYVQAELRRSGYEGMVGAGIVLTGGASKIEGVLELAEEIFHLPVSQGSPRHVTGLKDIVKNPVYATGVGLLMYGKQREDEQREQRGKSRITGGGFGRLRRWLSENF